MAVRIRLQELEQEMKTGKTFGSAHSLATSPGRMRDLWSLVIF